MLLLFIKSLVLHDIRFDVADERVSQIPRLRVARRWPVVLCYAGPESPNREYGEYRKEDFEHATIYFAIGSIADMD